MSAPNPQAKANLLSLPIPGEPSKQLLELLKENHVKWHIFFNEQGFHNHTSHTLLALHTLGATTETLTNSYKHTSAYQRAAFPSPNDVDEGNWKSFLGDPKYWSAYLKFFETELDKRGVQGLLEHFVFSEEGNIDSSDPPKSPYMLSRLLDSIQHPMIHVGYSLEFLKDSSSPTADAGTPNGTSDISTIARIMLIEGLAQTAVHRPSSAKLLPSKLFASGGTTTTTDSKEPVHALIILGRIMADPSFGDFKPTRDFGEGYKEALAKFGEAICDLSDEWIGGGGVAKDARDLVNKKVEEIIWAVTLIYGVSGYKLGKERPSKFGFIANFLFAHFITASFFLPAFAEHLSPRSALLLLRSYFSAVISIWLLFGRPGFDKDTLKAFFDDESLLTKLEAGSDDQKEGAKAEAPGNQEGTWERIVAISIPHLDEHVPKLQRSLKYFAELLGETKAGHFKDQGTATGETAVVGMEGAEYIDGSLFLRTAVLSARRIGTMENVAEHNSTQVERLENTFVWDFN